MAQLEFTESGCGYAAETTVNGDYALHLERVKGGTLRIYQRSTDSGQYAPCALPPALSEFAPQVIDWSFSHGVYPMHVRIESGTRVTYGVLTEGQ